MKNKVLKINGFKKITQNKPLWHEKYTHKDKVVTFRYCFSSNNKLYYVFGNDMQIIGYTDDFIYSDLLVSKIEHTNYLEFWTLCGRK